RPLSLRRGVSIPQCRRCINLQVPMTIRLLSRAKGAASLADVRRILDPLFQPDDARHEAIRDASADTRTEFLRVLAACLVAIDDRHDALQARGCGQILKKANELIKKGMGINPQILSNREKAKLVDALKQTYALPELLAALGLARSSYFYHRARLLVADRHAGARRVIADIFELNHRCDGYRRIRAALIRQRVFISEKVVRRLMRQEGLAAATTRRRRYGSYRGEISPAPENIINRDFYAAAPNQKWLTDLTEFQIPAGKVYLSPVIDCFDGLVVSWSIGTRPDAELVNTMLDSAIESVAGCKERPVVHSDRGAHYRWPGWFSRMQSARLTRSMSRKGCWPDNAACEGFFGRLKTELFYSRDWRTTTIDQFIEAVDSYIRWYNAKRIKVSLDSLSPIEYRQSLGIAA
ncbi:IS3 family transposase, partial [Paraburkholderia sp. SIMBA_055]